LIRRATIPTASCVAWFLLAACGASVFACGSIRAQESQPTQGRPAIVDGIAVRIEGDILTESEIDELAAFQKLVDGKSNSRADVVHELTDQWIVKNEAQTSHFARPSAEDVNEAFESLATQVGSKDALLKKMAEVGLTESAVRRQLELQIYLNRFLDYKFRAAAQVDEQQIKDYYSGEFTQQAKANGQVVPPLDDVHAEIHRLLTERIITDRATKWLDDARARLRIEILPKAGAS
jgi:hypothetical protein